VIDDLKQFMVEEGYYNQDENKFDWEQGINGLISDTTCCDEDYVVWEREDVTLDVFEVGLLPN